VISFPEPKEPDCGNRPGEVQIRKKKTAKKEKGVDRNPYALVDGFWGGKAANERSPQTSTNYLSKEMRKENK